MAHITRFVHNKPCDLDITPHGAFVSVIDLFRDGSSALESLHKLADFSTSYGPPSTAWLLSQSTGVTLGLPGPRLTLHVMRCVDDTDEQIEAARKAVVADLSAAMSVPQSPA